MEQVDSALESLQKRKDEEGCILLWKGRLTSAIEEVVEKTEQVDSALESLQKRKDEEGDGDAAIAFDKLWRDILCSMWSLNPVQYKNVRRNFLKFPKVPNP